MIYKVKTNLLKPNKGKRDLFLLNLSSEEEEEERESPSKQGEE